ncbi:MAG: glycosyl hydrolase 115 family protein [Lachnospiraceae bacterium]|nr:glycosyl hydrolase 115 family protein [Lachnospiraceae bacterium]
MDFLIQKGQQCPVQMVETETEAVKIAVTNLKMDLEKVLGAAVTIGENKIIVGTIGVSTVVESLIGTDISKLQDESGVLRKEAYLLKVYDGNLVIAGTDRRGTIYGIYEFCEYMGVSPWYFFADVPVKEKAEVKLPADYEKVDYPSVEYRGIFINDEEELEAWVQNYMGEDTIGVKTYEKIFELLLRLKANYIWPAMHVNSFNVKKENGALAERMGIVVGTSHCDMLMRSNNREWKPWIAKKGYTDAEYDYSIPGRNREILQEYWRESVEQNQDFEVCYTLGMRGIHDSGFETRDLEGKSEEEIKKAKVELLTTIIHDQQDILKETLGHDTMMTFIPYKEVLELYDSGMEIPEELTLVWANDNYGYIRRYPSEKEKNRKGGNGIYYHNSYWSPPSMSYVFFCSIPLAHTRNELRKAYEEGIQKLWVMNVGAMKPLEQEISFYLRLAWEIGKENALTDDVDAFVEDWINKTFSGNMGKEVATMLNDFSQLTNVRKVENMDYDAFSQTAYGDEAVVRIHAYEELFQRGNALYALLPEEEKDAFFQMVLMRIHAAYFTNLQYYYGDRSTLMHSKGKMQAAAFYAKKAVEFDDARRKMLVYYNTIMADGKWNGIVNPEGFPPPRAAMMPVYTPPLAITGEPRMLVDVWNEEEEICFVKPGEKWIELANIGQGEFTFEIQAPQWVILSKSKGVVSTEERILVKVIEVSKNCQDVLKVKNLDDGTIVEVPVSIVVPDKLNISDTNCCNVEEDGKVVVDADSVNCEGTGFHCIKRLGRGVGSLIEACHAQEIVADKIKNVNRADGANHVLKYSFFTINAGDATLEIHRFPSLDSVGRIRIGVSVDGGSVQIVETPSTDEWRGNWKKNVLNNVDRLYLELPNLKAGEHTITFYPVDKYFAFSRFVIYTKERKPNNYIGIAGNQQLPKLWDTLEWTEEFYGDIALSPRPIEYAQVEKEEDTLVKADLVQGEVNYAKTVEPGWYLQEGGKVFEERGGAICIDAASALAQSSYAYTSKFAWQYCGSESYGRSGLAMYIRQPELKWQVENAPTLNYRVQCSGGDYTIWVLAKFNVKEESFMGVGVDGTPLPKEQLYKNGCLWRYEAEQIYRWVPIASTTLSAGEHELQIYALASGMRYDRIYVTKGSELPPVDSKWLN